MALPFYAEKLPVYLVCYFLVFICILILLKRVVDYKRYRFNKTGTKWIGTNVLSIKTNDLLAAS